MKKYRKKPVVIEAYQWTGKLEECRKEFLKEIEEGKIRYRTCNILEVATLNGPVLVSCGEWIIRGVEGEIYPCDSKIFDKTYEFVED